MARHADKQQRLVQDYKVFTQAYCNKRRRLKLLGKFWKAKGNYAISGRAREERDKVINHDLFP